MTDFEVGLASFPTLLALIFMRIPIGLAMFLVAFAGLVIVTGGVSIPLAKLKFESYTTFSSYSLSIVPIFLLMGQFATMGGISQALFRAAESFLGHLKGGVAMAAVGACAGFGSICGSSLSTAATMGRIALPELRNRGYSSGFSCATLAAGGTLGILIPPSIVLVIYALLTEQNVAKLFVAAVIPGLLAVVGYITAIRIYAHYHPDSIGTPAPVSRGERIRALGKVWPILVIFASVIGGIYLGWFTPVEGAAVGATGTGLIAAVNGGLTRSALQESLLQTARSTGMIFFIFFGAAFYSGFLAFSRVPQEISELIVNQGFNPWAILGIMLIFYLVLGCMMDSLSMIMLTMPVFFPVISALDFGMNTEQVAIWFGVLVLIIVEVGLITPPVGMNIFIIRSLETSTPLTEIYRAVSYFVVSDLVRVILIILFPVIAVCWL